MTKYATYIVSDQAYTKHLTGPGHPEQPARIPAVIIALEQAGLKTATNSLMPRRAIEEEILLCHSQSYLELVKSEISQLASWEVSMLSTGDAPISAASWDIALLASGGVLRGIDQLFLVPDSRVFCAVRPPGHHAGIQYGRGFCLFNHVAIAARYAQKKYGIGRVLIADWDVHHGDGTQDIFYEDPSVFYFSTHQSPFYPGTGSQEERGRGLGQGTTMNFPIRKGLSSRFEVLKAFRDDLTEQMKLFQPELVLISAGFDGHRDDPLGEFNLIEEDFEALTFILSDIANRYAKGRIASVLEGGYNLKSLANSTIAHVKTLGES